MVIQDCLGGGLVQSAVTVWSLNQTQNGMVLGPVGPWLVLMPEIEQPHNCKLLVNVSKLFLIVPTAWQNFFTGMPAAQASSLSPA